MVRRNTYLFILTIYYTVKKLKRCSVNDLGRELNSQYSEGIKKCLEMFVEMNIITKEKNNWRTYYTFKNDSK